MSKKKRPKPSPHPDLKYTGHAYMWMLGALLFILLGVSTVVRGEFRGRAGSARLSGNAATVLGWGLIGYGAYLGYIVLYRAKKIELAQKHFHELKPFKKEFAGYQTEFEIPRDTLFRGSGTSVPVFYYKVQVSLKNRALPDFKITRRGGLGLIAWYLGPGRIGDILTGSTYFDARYKVAGPNKSTVQAFLSREIVEAISYFDRDYPPILTKNGWLRLDHHRIQYTEGPYNNEEKLFTMHRGRLDLLISELIILAEKLDATKR